MPQNTFTLADLTNFKLPETAEVKAPPAEPAEPQPAESSAAPAVPSDEPPVEISAETTPAPTAGEADPEPSAEAPGDTKDEKYIPKGRFDEVIDERNALRRFNEYLLSREGQAAPAPTPAPVATTAHPAEAVPTLEGCGFDTVKYEQSMKDWTAKQVEAAKAQGAQSATEASARAAFDARLETYLKANPAAKAVFSAPNNVKPLDREAQKIVVESEMGPQILYHLLANPDQAVRIARKSMAQQVADIGRIEGELRVKATKPPQKTTPNITRAPNPPTPTAGRGNTPSIDPLKLSTKEWIAWDRQQEMEKRRARKGARSA